MALLGGPIRARPIRARPMGAAGALIKAQLIRAWPVRAWPIRARPSKAWPVKAQGALEGPGGPMRARPITARLTRAEAGPSELEFSPLDDWMPAPPLEDRPLPNVQGKVPVKFPCDSDATSQ